MAQLPNATRVAEDSSEFRSVTEAFMRTARKYCKRIAILQVSSPTGARVPAATATTTTTSVSCSPQVDKLQNQLLYHQYQLKRMSVQQDATDQEFERILYHGTSEDTVKEICLHGFNRSFCGKNGTSPTVPPATAALVGPSLTFSSPLSSHRLRPGGVFRRRLRALAPE